MAIVLGGGRPPFYFFWTFLYCISTLGFGGHLPGESRDDDTHDTIEALVLAIIIITIIIMIIFIVAP